MSQVIRVENVAKQYRLGQVGTGTLSDDLTRLWYRLRGKEDPFLKIGHTNDRTKKADVPIPGKKSGLISRFLHVASRSASSELVWALKDINFDVSKGEVLGIIGRNGAGKSTLLKILARVTTPTMGQVKIKGRIASLLEVGTGFHPDLTGRENIYLNGAILGMRKEEINRKLDQIIDFSGCERYIDTPVKRYSSGMYVRLAFAVAAHLDPEILVVDEVLAVGDADFQKKCLGKMKEVSVQEGRTVLFVSHNLAAIASLTTRCVLMSNGSIRYIGSTTDAINIYMGSGQDSSLEYSEMQSPLSSKPKIRSVKLKTSLPGNIHVNNSNFEINIELETPRPLLKGCISVQVFDSEQVNFVHVWNHDVNLPMLNQGRNYSLRCQIPRLRLYMGNYRLRVFFSEPPGGESFEILDGICPFEVVMQDNSRLFQWWPKECAYLEDSQWDVHAHENDKSGVP